LVFEISVFMFNFLTDYLFLHPVLTNEYVCISWFSSNNLIP
jgi:hypothetical protein